MSEEEEQLTPEEIFELVRNAGFDPLEARTATAIVLAESSGIPTRENNGAYGLFQIKHKETIQWLIDEGHIDDVTDLLEPEKNAKAAYYMAHHHNLWSNKVEKAVWSDWATHPDSRYYEPSASIEKMVKWHPRDDNTETALDAATRVFHSWAGDDSDALYPEDVGGFGEPGSEASTTDADTLRSQIPDQVPFDDRVRRAMMDKNTPKIIPLQTRMSGQEFSALQRGTQDPGMRAALSRHAENFRTGNAGFLGYETDEAASTAAKWLRVYGIGVDSQFPFIAYSLGKQAIDKTGDIASQLWDKAIGSLWGGGDEIDRSAYLDSGSDEISDDLNPERR